MRNPTPELLIGYAVVDRTLGNQAVGKSYKRKCNVEVVQSHITDSECDSAHIRVITDCVQRDSFAPNINGDFLMIGLDVHSYLHGMAFKGGGDLTSYESFKTTFALRVHDTKFNVTGELSRSWIFVFTHLQIMDTLKIDRSIFGYLLLMTQLEFTIRFLKSYFALSEAESRDLFCQIETNCWEECLQDPTQLKHPQRLIRRCAPPVAIDYLKKSGTLVTVD